MARLPNGCSRMLCALLQFGSFVCAVNSPSPATARTRRKDPFTALSNRFSSLSSSTRPCPETTTNGVPIMSSQKIGPNSLASRARFCVGALESSDSMLPTTGFFGGCGIGLSLLVDAIAIMSPAVSLNPCRHCEERLRRSNPLFVGCRRWIASRSLSSGARSRDPLARNDGVLYARSPEPLSTPFDQLGADLIRLFLLRPMAAAANQVFLEIGDDLLHAVSRGW